MDMQHQLVPVMESDRSMSLFRQEAEPWLRLPSKLQHGLDPVKNMSCQEISEGWLWRSAREIHQVAILAQPHLLLDFEHVWRCSNQCVLAQEFLTSWRVRRLRAVIVDLFWAVASNTTNTQCMQVEHFSDFIVSWQKRFLNHQKTDEGDDDRWRN